MVCGGIMNKLLKLGITVISLFAIILAIIIIMQLIHLAISAQLIDAYATLSLAFVTVFAVFYQPITRYITRPKFDVKFAPSDEEIRLKITNNGKSTAHLCRVAIEVYDENNKLIMPLFLPWDIQNDKLQIKVYSEFTNSKDSIEEISAPVTYDGIVLYSREYEFVKLFFVYAVNSLCLYGYPYIKHRDITPPLVISNRDGNNELQHSKNYKIKLTVFCEEVSQRCLKTIYFNVGTNNIFRYGFNKKMDEPQWQIQ